MPTEPTTVLLVDDSRTILLSVTSILEHAKYKCWSAVSAEAALQLVDTGFVPDVVITDLNMPGMGGIELVTELRSRPGFAAVPIFILTTESHRDTRQQGRAVGATGWLVKPIKPTALLQVLHQVMTRA